jgi:hypothetical protein
MKRQLRKVLRFTGEAVAPRGLDTSQGVLMDSIVALRDHTVQHPVSTGFIHREGRRMGGAVKPVESLLPLALQTNIMPLQLKQAGQVTGPLFAEIAAISDEQIIVIGWNGTSHFPANSPRA